MLGQVRAAKQLFLEKKGHLLVVSNLSAVSPSSCENVRHRPSF